MTFKLIVLGCVAGKRKIPHGSTIQAQHLYDSQLWRARRRYVELVEAPWLILSARHGLIEPTKEVASYDQKISSIPEQWSPWHESVKTTLLELTRTHGALTLELHASAPYVERLSESISTILPKPILLLPMKGLQIGEQKAFYKNHYINQKLQRARA